MRGLGGRTVDRGPTVTRPEYCERFEFPCVKVHVAAVDLSACRPLDRLAKIALSVCLAVSVSSLLCEDASAGVGDGSSPRFDLAEEAPAYLALEPGPLAWIGAELERNGRVRLPAMSSLPLLARYANPAVERSGAWRRFWVGRYGPGGWSSWMPLSWSTNSCREDVPAKIVTQVDWRSLDQPRWRSAAVPIASTSDLDEISSLLDRWLVPRDGVMTPQWSGIESTAECQPWQLPRPVTFFRIDHERDTFRLLECDGSVSPDAIDRLSVMARPPGVPRPNLPLSNEPDPAARRGEWLPKVKLVHPRLVWAIQQIASAYPTRAIYVVSGYRPDAGRSFHARGRALDIQIVGVPNERTFGLCRELPDVACGYYPNDRFVHVDVRGFAVGHPFWIDAAQPGEPSQYVDSWPGVIDGGAILHGGEL